jgi:hypothetical protein
MRNPRGMRSSRPWNSPEEVPMKDQHKAKYEFRIFTREPDAREKRIESTARLVKALEGEEIYLLSRDNDSSNVKIRDGRMDIKELLGVKEGLELWVRTLKTPFPLDVSVLERKVYPALKIPIPRPELHRYTQEQFLGEILAPDTHCVSAKVYKKRMLYTFDECRMECAQILIDESPYITIGVESADVEPVLKAIKILGFSAGENVNYVRALKEIKGLA